MTSIKLLSGLNGVQGCVYSFAKDQLIFVESAKGQISALDRILAVSERTSFDSRVVSSGYILDFVKPTVPGQTTGDIKFEGVYDKFVRISTVGAAKFHPLDTTEFENITGVMLQRLTYSKGSATCNAFAVLTNEGVLGKAKIKSIDIDGGKAYIEFTCYNISQNYKILGSGYNQPRDIVVTSDWLHAYVTEGNGNFLEVDLANANRNNAKPKISGLTAPHQIALDEDKGLAYLVEYANPGRLLRIDLADNSKTVLINNLVFPVGLVMTRDFQYAYIAEQTMGQDKGHISCITLSSGNREILIKGLTKPFFMKWTDANENRLFITEANSVNRVNILDLSQRPVTSSPLGKTLLFHPSNTVRVATDRAIICGDSEIDMIDLTGDYFSNEAPLLMGIGFVPSTKISSEGYASTEKGYFFYVKDAPFGGTLPIMLNHERFRGIKEAAYYQILVDDAKQDNNWSDYLWVNSQNCFVLTPALQEPSDKSLFPLRKAGDIWYNYWLGYFLDTREFTDGTHKIKVRILNSAKIELAKEEITVCIDNTWPRAVIEKITYYDPKNPDPEKRQVDIPACGIAQGNNDEFTFFIEASDPISQHLLSWHLSVMWGDNKSALIKRQNYEEIANNPPHKWPGVHGIVPFEPEHWHASVKGDESSKKCAHTIYLGVWDRVINGWGYIHYSDYHKSITILVDQPD